MSNRVMNACRPAQMPPTPKNVLMHIADRAHDDGLAWPSIPGICEATCFGRTAVIEALKWLERAGFVSIEKATGRNNRIAVNLVAVAAHVSEAEQQRARPARAVCPPPVREADPSGRRTSAAAGPVREADPTRPGGGPPPVREADLPVREADPNHQEPSEQPSITQEGAVAPLSPTPSATAARDIPPCPVKELVAMFKAKVPELPKPRYELWKDSKGADAMRQRWKWLLDPETKREDGSRYAETREQAIEWFGKFFDVVASSDFLTGRSGDWGNCDLAWLMKRESFMKVVQGNYDNKPQRVAA